MHDAVAVESGNGAKAFDMFASTREGQSVRRDFVQSGDDPRDSGILKTRKPRRYVRRDRFDLIGCRFEVESKSFLRRRDAGEDPPSDSTDVAPGAQVDD